MTALGFHCSGQTIGSSPLPFAAHGRHPRRALVGPPERLEHGLWPEFNCQPSHSSSGFKRPSKWEIHSKVASRASLSPHFVPYLILGFTVGIPEPKASGHCPELFPPATDRSFLQIASIFSTTIDWWRLTEVRSTTQSSSVLDSILSSKSRVSSNFLAIYPLFCFLFSRFKRLILPQWFFSLFTIPLILPSDTVLVIFPEVEPSFSCLPSFECPSIYLQSPAKNSFSFLADCYPMRSGRFHFSVGPLPNCTRGSLNIGWAIKPFVSTVYKILIILSLNFTKSLVTPRTNETDILGWVIRHLHFSCFSDLSVVMSARTRLLFLSQQSRRVD